MKAKEVIKIPWQAIKKAALWIYKNSDWIFPVVTSTYETIKLYFKKKKDERKRICKPRGNGGSCEMDGSEV